MDTKIESAIVNIVNILSWFPCFKFIQCKHVHVYIYIYLYVYIYIYIEMHIHLWIYMRCICLFSVFECVLIPFWCPVISFQGTGALPTARRPAAHGESSCHFQNRFVKLVTVLVMVLVPVLNNSGYC